MTEQNHGSSYTLAIGEFSIIINDRNLHVKRDGAEWHATLPLKPLRLKTEDHNLVRPHLSEEVGKSRRGRRHNKKRLAIDAQTLSLVPVVGVEHWPGVIKFGEPEARRFQRRAEAFAKRNKPLEGSVEVLDQVVELYGFPFEVFRPIWDVIADGAKRNAGSLLLALDPDRVEAIIEDDAFVARTVSFGNPLEAVAFVRESRDRMFAWLAERFPEADATKWPAPQIMLFGKRAVPDTDEVEDVRVIVFPHESGWTWQMWDETVIRTLPARFMAQVLGPTAIECINVMLEKMGVEIDRDVMKKRLRQMGRKPRRRAPSRGKTPPKTRK